MCLFCAQMFAEIHWSERLLDPPHLSNGTSETTRRRQRLAQISLIGKILTHYGLDISDDWSATNYVLSNRKGQADVVATLGELWPAAASMAGRVLDPLDPRLLDGLCSGSWEVLS